MKRLLSIFLSIAMLLSLAANLNITAYADTVASGTCGQSGNTINWVLDSNGVITFSGENQRMEDFVNGGAARPAWYSYADQIKKVVMQEGVINIGAYAFADCYNLSEVDFGTIDTLGNNAFENCGELKHISLPSQCNWMYEGVFLNCYSLQSANLGEKWWTQGTVPNYFFQGCAALSVIKMGSNYTGFEADTLSGCDNLTAIITDNTSINSDSTYTVYRTNELSGICSDNTYSQSKLEWHYDIDSARLYFTGSGDLNYYDKGSEPWADFIEAVNTVDFSQTDAKASVSTTSFQGREHLENVDFTNVYAIGWGAFAECYNLGSLSFDSELTAIWNYAFANDDHIERIVFQEGTDDLHIYPWAFNNCTGTTFWVNLPSNTRYIDDHAFWNTNFNYNTINSTNVTIGEDAFGNGKGDYARFFGVGGTDTGVYSWVKACRENKGYNWWYYCSGDNHLLSFKTVEPTCTEQGYDEYGCHFCDDDTNRYKTNYTEALGHNYRYISSGNLVINYNCLRCGETNLGVSALDVEGLFEGALSSTAGDTKFNQSDYDGRADLNVDGVINAKDFILLRDILNAPDLTGKETVIDLNTKYQTIEGFGASAAWWSQYVGEWENAEDIIKLLYSDTDGIGLNIYRYNLGAGSKDSPKNSVITNGDASTHCFLQSDGTYNWNNDAGAMNCLEIADRLNPDLKVTLFSNSAPVYMTDNGFAFCSPNTASNLSTGNYQNFANFVSTCAEHFIDEGYNVTSVSPINEPEWDWAGTAGDDGKVYCSQEGCHYTYSTALDFYNNYMIPTLKNNSKLNGRVGVEVWECAQLQHSSFFSNFFNYLFSSKDYDRKIAGVKIGDGYAKANSNIRSYVDALSTHSYWASTDDRNNTASQLSGEFFGQKVRETEYCQMFNDGSSGVYGHIAEEGATNGMGIDYGLALADIIWQDMTILNTVEWDWWTACSKGVYTDGLVYVNANNHDHIETAKRLWTLGNYSKFIDEGAVRVKVETGSALGANLVTKKTYSWDDNGTTRTDKNNYLEESAYLNPDGTVVVVYINNSDTIEFTTFDSSAYESFTSYVTDEFRNLERYQSGDASKPVCLPAKSVTTVVLTTPSSAAKSTEGAYLFSYFTGNAQSEQRIRFAVSKDGYNYTPLNSNNPVITQNLGTLNCRDPYIFKGQDGYYYIIATDMDASNNQWWGNSNTMVIWRSIDLVNWTDETIINMSEITNAPDIQRCWAPQVLWDEQEQKYLVYFGLASWSVTQNKTEMYYCYTDDLLDQSSYTYPQLLYEPSDGGAAIDGDIFYDSESGTYYLYYKDETNATICYVTSNSLTGPYGDAANPTKVINSDVGLEGCNSYFITGTDTLVMLADAYGDGYFVMNQSKDFRNFYPVTQSAYTINNCSPRHGSVIAISDAEYNALVNSFGF